MKKTKKQMAAQLEILSLEVLKLPKVPLSVRDILYYKAKCKTVEDVVALFIESDQLVPSSKKLKGVGKMFYFHLYKFLGEHGFIKKFDVYNPPTFAKPTARPLMEEEIGKPHIKFVYQLKLTDTTKTILIKSMMVGNFSRITTQLFVKFFVRINLKTGELIFKPLTGKNPRVNFTQKHIQQLFAANNEIKRKLQELNYLM